MRLRATLQASSFLDLLKDFSWCPLSWRALARNGHRHKHCGRRSIPIFRRKENASVGLAWTRLAPLDLLGRSVALRAPGHRHVFHRGMTADRLRIEPHQFEKLGW